MHTNTKRRELGGAITTEQTSGGARVRIAADGLTAAQAIQLGTLLAVHGRALRAIEGRSRLVHVAG
jgi:hypothetical protein